MVAAKLSLRLALVGESVTPLWPPTGIALVAFLWFGPRIWPGVAAAALLVNLPISPSWPAAAGIAVGNTLAPLLALRLLRLAGFRDQLDRLRDALALVFLGALGAMTVSASFGTTSLLASEAITGGEYAQTWSVWWTGDAMGILAVAPFLLGLRSLPSRASLRWRSVPEAVALAGALAAAAVSLLGTGRPVWVAVFPLLGWIAWRYKQRGAGPAALAVILAATWAAAHDNGPFASAGLLDKMVTLQVFNAAVAFTSFFFAAVVAERERAETERATQLAREREAQALLYRREHRIAQTLQRSLLPDRMPQMPDVRAVARYVPATGDVDVGGDWYDMIALRDGRLGLGIGDVAGHGIGAAAAMGQVRMALRAYLLEGLGPARILERLNSMLSQLQPGAMTTLVCAHLDPDSGALTIARAGHPPALVCTRGGEAWFVEGGSGPPLGVAANIVYAETIAELPAGGTLVLYTDGLVERRRESLERGLDRLRAAVSRIPGDLEAACDQIIAEVLEGAEGSDDAALLAVRRESLAGRPLHLSVPAHPHSVAEIRHIVGRWLRHNAVGSDEVSEIVLACSELCSNVVQHAYGEQEGVIQIDASVGDGAITITVRDYGQWRVPAARDDEGRGLSVVRGLMDTVEVDSGPEGTSVRMRRARSPVA